MSGRKKSRPSASAADLHRRHVRAQKKAAEKLQETERTSAELMDALENTQARVEFQARVLSLAPIREFITANVRFEPMEGGQSKAVLRDDYKLSTPPDVRRQRAIEALAPYLGGLFTGDKKRLARAREAMAEVEEALCSDPVVAGAVVEPPPADEVAP